MAFMMRDAIKAKCICYLNCSTSPATDGKNESAAQQRSGSVAVHIELLRFALLR